MVCLTVPYPWNNHNIPGAWGVVSKAGVIVKLSVPQWYIVIIEGINSDLSILTTVCLRHYVHDGHHAIDNVHHVDRHSRYCQLFRSLCTQITGSGIRDGKYCCASRFQEWACSRIQDIAYFSGRSHFVGGGPCQPTYDNTWLRVSTVSTTFRDPELPRRVPSTLTTDCQPTKLRSHSARRSVTVDASQMLRVPHQEACAMTFLRNFRLVVCSVCSLSLSVFFLCLFCVICFPLSISLFFAWLCSFASLFSVCLFFLYTSLSLPLCFPLFLSLFCSRSLSLSLYLSLPPVFVSLLVSCCSFMFSMPCFSPASFFLCL